jgi:cholesterol oxidase
MRAPDYDWIVIGSGFGGSVSALRLAEKGYRVCVLECGRRYEDADFAKTTWNARRYFWAPKLGLRGIFRMTPFKDVFVVSGSGVGGGSLGYANTLYRARPAFFRDPQWEGLGEWERELGPHYDTAERMLGVTEFPGEGPADLLLKQLGEEMGVGDTYKPTRVGVYFGEDAGEGGAAAAGANGEDPYFGGEGPARHPCTLCGSCMVGCRHGAKNTLRKNYLHFAERLGVRIQAERNVTDVRPLGAADGSDGYRVTHERSGAWLDREPRTLTARGIVVAAGALGTNSLLRNCRDSGALPRLSDRIGELVRTNSESILAVTAPDDSRDFARSIAITSSIYPDPDTHIEVVTYGHGGDSMSTLYTLLTGNGTRLTRPLMWLGAVARRPLRFLRLLWPFGWSRRTIILLVMQTVDNAIRLVPKRKLLGRGLRLQTEQDPGKPIPTYIPVADKAARRMAEIVGGTPQAGFTESIFNIPTTAHILGGAAVGAGPESGVVDARHRAFGYENLLVCDGSSVPANPGVNPSLTITAMAERAMTFIPEAEGTERAELPERARAAA